MEASDVLSCQVVWHDAGGEGLVLGTDSREGREQVGRGSIKSDGRTEAQQEREQ